MGFIHVHLHGAADHLRSSTSMLINKVSGLAGVVYYMTRGLSTRVLGLGVIITIQYGDLVSVIETSQMTVVNADIIV